MKTKYMVYTMDGNMEMEVQTVLDNKEDCEWYANDCLKSGCKTQYIAKFTTLKIMKTGDTQ